MKILQAVWGLFCWLVKAVLILAANSVLFSLIVVVIMLAVAFPQYIIFALFIGYFLFVRYNT